MAAVFCLTVFLSATLLFVLEPITGKVLLPTFGGSPAVWNTCLAFYQTVLLAAYSYAHWLTRISSARIQVLVHLAVVMLPWLVLPLYTQADATPPGRNPLWPLIARLASTAGLPLFVVASTSPLVGQWFANFRPRAAADPYSLYVASNAGSMLGLLSYPFFLEPKLSLTEQARQWSTGYAVFLLLLATCFVAVWRARPRVHLNDAAGNAAAEKPTFGSKIRWVALAFIPSSLLLGVTAYLSTDVSPVPFVWVVPLALYLLSFMLAFSRLPAWAPRLFAALLAGLVLVQIYQAFPAPGPNWQPMWRVALLHLVSFFCAAMVCHGELARRRPDPTYLTSYYFWLSLGGVLGGCFNALLAPLLFKSLIEYPLALSAACMFSPFVAWRLPRRRRWLDPALAAAITLAAGALLYMNTPSEYRWPFLLCAALGAIVAARPVAFGLVAAALFVLAGHYDDAVQCVVLRERDFYGALKVYTDTRQEYYYLAHGRVLHGVQRRSDDPAVRDMPLGYFCPTSPIGQVFSTTPVLKSRPPVAVVGLGAGTLAQYGQAGQEFVFYEIDPAVEPVARDDRYFTYLRDSKANCRVVLGDARLSLHSAPDGHYGLIVIDAFSGDAIPIHLLTYEAMQLYRRKLAPHGVIALHLSNSFLDLSAVFANLADASSLVAFYNYDSGTPQERANGKLVSQWGIVAGAESDFGQIVRDDNWHRWLRSRKVSLWTDQYTSLWPILKWW